MVLPPHGAWVIETTGGEGLKMADTSRGLANRDISCRHTYVTYGFYGRRPVSASGASGEERGATAPRSRPGS